MSLETLSTKLKNTDSDSTMCSECSPNAITSYNCYITIRHTILPIEKIHNTYKVKLL